MTLTSSLPSAGGLPPSLTVDLDTPEERLAARMVQRLGLEPPVDVEKIAAALATVTTKDFPIEIDGLCLDLKVQGKRPRIWVSRRLHRVRRRFTLAHEIGHIIIPWHTGTIVDDLDAPRRRERGKYREMEAEANRFAAELMMPTSWILRTIERTAHATALMETIVQVADVSYPAALFRVQELAPSGFIGAEIRGEMVVWSGRTKGTRAKPPEVGTRLDEMQILAVHEPRTIHHGPSRYIWWKVRDEVTAPPEPKEPWRGVLDSMLLSVPTDHQAITRSRVNAVIGGAFGRTPKGTAVDRLYKVALDACQNRNDRDRYLRIIFSHPEFPKYLIARCYERAKAT